MTARLWTLLGVPALARAGRRTRLVQNPSCRECGAHAPALATDLEVVLERWEGEPLFTAAQFLIVTAPLARAIEGAGLTGCALHEVTARHDKSKSATRLPTLSSSSTGSSMGEVHGSKKSLPELEELSIVASCKGPSGWWRRGAPCSACGRPSWEDDAGLAMNRNAALGGRPCVPRQIWATSWHGLDFAQPDDPGPPVVSSRARAVLESVAPGLRFLPVQLVGAARGAAGRPSDAHLARIRRGLRDHESERESAQGTLVGSACEID